MTRAPQPSLGHTSRSVTQPIPPGDLLGAGELLRLPPCKQLRDLWQHVWPQASADLFLAAAIALAVRGSIAHLEADAGIAVPLEVHNAVARCHLLAEGPQLRNGRGPCVLVVPLPGQPPLHLPCSLDLEHDDGGLFAFPEPNARDACRVARRIAA